MTQSVKCLDNSFLLCQKNNVDACINQMKTKGVDPLLVKFYNICQDELISRNLTDGTDVKYYELHPDGKVVKTNVNVNRSLRHRVFNTAPSEKDIPWYFGWEPFHKSHQAILMRYNPNHYSQIFTDLESYYINRGCIWPSHHDPNEVLYLDPSQFDDYWSGSHSLFEAPPTMAFNMTTSTNRSPSGSVSYTVVQLKQMAREQKLVGYSKMRKDELLQLLGLQC